MNNRLLSALTAFCFLFVLSSCEDDPKLPDILVEFEAEVAGFSAEESSFDVAINLSRPASEDVVVTVSLTATGLQYGTDFTTSPEPIENVISVSIPAGETQGVIVLTKINGVGFTGDETVIFSITEITGSPLIGTIPQVTVSFSEITVANANMNIQGGGPTFPNRVFIDLSANRQTSINRTHWDFGFYTAGGQFRVILNSSLSMLAKPTERNDMNAVTASDTVGMKSTFTTDAFSTANLPYIDAPSGDMSATAFAEISAIESDNKVYIVNRGKDVNGTQRSWKKVRVLRNGTGYTIQYADINAASFQTIQVTRNEASLFNYISVDQQAIVSVEPEKGKWDFAYTPFMNSTNLGTGLIPYMFNDIIIQNRYSVETAELLIANVGEYADFDQADLTGVTFGTNQINIGSRWRTGGGPSSAPALRTDRFYLIKDAEGNIYKMKFTALTQNGERGRPAIEFALIKAGV